jgi:hypothetical protein
MTTRTIRYSGEDYIIPREEIEALGIQPGNEFVLELRPKVVLVPRAFPPEEVARRRAILADLWGSWSAEDEAAFRRNRELWSKWEPRK